MSEKKSTSPLPGLRGHRTTTIIHATLNMINCSTVPAERDGKMMVTYLFYSTRILDCRDHSDSDSFSLSMILANGYLSIHSEDAHWMSSFQGLSFKILSGSFQDFSMMFQLGKQSRSAFIVFFCLTL